MRQHKSHHQRLRRSSAAPVPEGKPWTITGTYLADSSGIQTDSGRLAVPGFVDICFHDPRGTCNKSVAVGYQRNGGLGGQTPHNWAEMTFLLVSDDAGAICTANCDACFFQ